MDPVWVFIALVVVVVIAIVLMRATSARGWMLWQLRDNNRGDGRLETFVAEEELKRTASPRDRDLAP